MTIDQAIQLNNEIKEKNKEMLQKYGSEEAWEEADPIGYLMFACAEENAYGLLDLLSD